MTLTLSPMLGFMNISFLSFLPGKRDQVQVPAVRPAAFSNVVTSLQDAAFRRALSLTRIRAGHAVYVVPAFQLQHGETRVPLDKKELLAMDDKVSQVHPEKGRDIAHMYTDYAKWRTATEIYRVQYSMPYEPYFVTNKRVPRYDTGFLGYGNDKTEHCLEVYKARMEFLVLPESFVFHVEHPRGEWQNSDQNWVVRAPTTLVRFLLDVQRRYSIPVDGRVEAVAGGPGENCTHVCEARGRGCRPDLAHAINTCERMRAAFGARCGAGAGAAGNGGCSGAFYGFDLPAHNADNGACLLNSKPDEYPTSCDVRNDKSSRLCPCGERLPQWLTAEHVVSTLSTEGKWDKVSPSLTGDAPPAARPAAPPRAAARARLRRIASLPGGPRWPGQVRLAAGSGRLRVRYPSCGLGAGLVARSAAVGTAWATGGPGCGAHCGPRSAGEGRVDAKQQSAWRRGGARPATRLSANAAGPHPRACRCRAPRLPLVLRSCSPRLVLPRLPCSPRGTLKLWLMPGLSAAAQAARAPDDSPGPDVGRRRRRRPAPAPWTPAPWMPPWPFAGAWRHGRRRRAEGDRRRPAAARQRHGARRVSRAGRPGPAASRRGLGPPAAA